VIEQRKTKRFDLHLPVEVVRSGSERVSQVGRTHNISSGGVLFTCPARMEVGGSVEYIITLAAGTEGHVNLRCMGKILRKEYVPVEPEEDAFRFAVSLERYEFLRSNGHPH
jgi:PilZ domain